MSAIQVSGLEAGYDVPVLHGIDLTVPTGGLTAVLGPSGSGRSTLLRVLAGLHRPSRGSVWIGERAVDDGALHLPPEARGVGLVPPSGALFPHLTVAGNIGFGLRERARDDRRRRVAELVGLIGLDGAERRLPHQLSGARRQLVAVARALAPRPEVVLLDEPFAAVDADLRPGLRTEVLRILQTAGVTALLATGDRVEAMSMAGSIALLRDGVVEQCGTPVDLYGSPSTPWAGTFLGDGAVLSGVTDGYAVTTALGTHSHAVRRPGAVRVLVRPEQLRLVDRHATATGVVEAVEFGGPDALVSVALARGHGVPPVPVRARVPTTDLPQIGARVGVAVQGSLRVFDE